MIVINSILIEVILNMYLFLQYFNLGSKVIFIIFGCIYFVIYCLFPIYSKQYGKKLQILRGGLNLLSVFLITVTVQIILTLYLSFLSEIDSKSIILNTVIFFIGEFIIFWNGIIRVYLTSNQLGIKWRIAGAVCGMIPIINIVMLIKIIYVISCEYRFERMVIQRDIKRCDKHFCKTIYPILMVHGVFFRDSKLINYWGRIADELEKNGAVIYYGNQQSASSVEESAKELMERMEDIIRKNGCKKLNVIAHSKGGLDARYAISILGADKYTASLTTINTPHHGCLFAEYLLKKVPERVRDSIADKYNNVLRKIGDNDPDFISAVTCLTETSCSELNRKCQDSSEVYYQSVGSKAKKASSGQFPLNLSYRFVKLFDGENDGLVSVNSMKWGNRFIFLEPKSKRGITHGDVIDLNRENIKGFDVREFYVNLVNDLKVRGF